MADFSAECPCKILSLDGGGAKGFYTLGVLREIEGMVKCPLHQKFDLIFGTRAGLHVSKGVGVSGDEVRPPTNNSPTACRFHQQLVMDRSGMRPPPLSKPSSAESPPSPRTSPLINRCKRGRHRAFPHSFDWLNCRLAPLPLRAFARLAALARRSSAHKARIG